MSDESHVTAQVFIGDRVRHAEDLAQAADAPGLKAADFHMLVDLFAPAGLHGVVFPDA